MRARGEYFVLRRSWAYAGQSSEPLGVADAGGALDVLVGLGVGADVDAHLAVGIRCGGRGDYIYRACLPAARRSLMRTMVMVPTYLGFRVMPRFVCIFDFVFSAARLGSMDRRTPGRESPAAA
jgi:hypothetical protein